MFTCQSNQYHLSCPHCGAGCGEGSGRRPYSPEIRGCMKVIGLSVTAINTSVSPDFIIECGRWMAD